MPFNKEIETMILKLSNFIQKHFVIVFNWNHFEMRLLNLIINFYLLQTFCPHFGSFFCLFVLRGAIDNNYGKQ